MANLRVVFDASISAALAAFEKLVAKDAETKKKLAESGPDKADRRSALEEVRTAKVATETAKREKLETQAAIKVQTATVRTQQAATDAAAAAVKASQEKGEATKKEIAELAKQTKELEKQRAELERLKSLGKIKGNSLDQATATEHQTRQSVRVIPPISPKVDPAPAASVFSRILSAGKSAATGIETRFQAMRTRISGIFSGISGVVTGALAFAGFSLGIGAIRGVITEMDNLGKTARNLSISAEELQKFQHAANSVNFPIQQIEPALNKMRKLIGDAADGIPEAKKKIDLLGLSLDDLNGKSTSAQLETVAGAINSITNPTERATAAARIFGDELGPRMLNFLREYKAASADLEARGIISDEQVKAAEDFNQACTNIMVSLKAWAVNTGFISQLKEVADLVAFITSNKGQKTEVDASKKGIFTRKTGTDYAIEQAEKSGNYTPEEIARMKGAAKDYKNADFSPISQNSDFGLIDRALKDAKLGGLARSSTNPFTRSWADSQQIATLPTAPEDVDAARKAREAEQAKKAEREKRRGEALQKSERDFNDKIDQQVSGLENKASGKSDDKEERRRAAIEAETDKAEQAAKAAGQKLTDEQRARVEKAAGQVFDAEESKNAGKAGEAIDDQITALEQKYELQKMIDSGKAREAAIQEEINKAEKSARAGGRELTDEEREKVSSAAGKNFDQAVAKEQSYVQGPQNKVFTDSLLRIGGVIGGVEGAAKTDYAKQQVDKLTGLDTKMAEIGTKIETIVNRTPGRLEAVAASDPEF